MRRLRAITFDFWSTLVDGASTPERAAARLARLHQAITSAGYACSVEELGGAVTRALNVVNEHARETLLDVGPPGRWAAVAAELRIPEGLVPFEVVERAYEHITLQPMPAVMPHIHLAVQAMQAAGYRLGLICNTGMAGGHVLREVLRRHGLFDFFSATVFSNEFGYAKPDPRIFAHTLEALGGIAPAEALHVGDLEELDVEGARRVGMFAALYQPEPGAGVATDADLRLSDWRDFEGLVRAFDASLSTRPRRR